jgi:hypothetical protein
MTVTETHSIQVLRDGSDPTSFDVEYTADFECRIRVDELEVEVDADGPENILFYPSVTADPVPVLFSSLSDSARARIQRAIMAAVQDMEHA